MSVVSSEYQESDFQPNGARTVRERIVMDDGQVFGFTWQGTANAAEVLAHRVDLLNQQAAEQAAALAVVAGTRLPITKYEFRALFTVQERMAVDAFNVSYDVNPGLSDTQKAQIRTGLQDFDAALSIAVPFLDSVVAMINLYQSVGILSEARAAEIISAGGQ